MAATALVLAGSLLLAGAASASGDRNRDRIPDRWERQHHLSLKVNQARRDQDGDGLNNRGEWKAKLDPRDDDTDDDGIEDGDENAGTVTSLTGDVLTIALAKGGTLVAKVTADTEIECDDATAKPSSDGPGDDDEGDDDGEHGDGDHEDHGDDSCGPEALTAGRAVEEAELKTRGGEAVWEKIELGAR
ncbi:hypothetical protein [Solirubrobacter soli]|uniref:hypothetical protein n=1 Tax=Solirubrobacter soli TaxID=363832 RepID=UPI0012FC5684|nr:hypothetical protein [Solirubrobacter soli]